MPLCTFNLGPDWVDPGTLNRQKSRPPGVGGSRIFQPRVQVALSQDLPHRLLLAATNGLPYLAPELRQQVAAFLTLENCAIMAALIAADIVFAGTGVGTVINVLAAGLAVAVIGHQGIEGARKLVRFYRLAERAKTRDDFAAAGQAFAQGITGIGIAGLTALLMRRAHTKVSGKSISSAGARQVEASWFALADSIEFKVPPNDGVIFAGLAEEEIVAAIARSKNPQGKIINDTARKYGWTQERMEQDFGKEHSATTYRLWEALSLKYQASLKGRVTAYIDSSKVRLDSTMFGTAELGSMPGAGAQVEMTAGKITPSVILTELEELMSSNPNITSILIKDVKTGQTWIHTPSMKSRLSH